MRCVAALSFCLVVFATGCTSFSGGASSHPTGPSLVDVRAVYRQRLDSYLTSLAELRSALPAKPEVDAPGNSDWRAENSARTLARDLDLALAIAYEKLGTSNRPIAVIENLKNARLEAIERAQNGLGSSALERAQATSRYKTLFADPEDEKWRTHAKILQAGLPDYLEHRAALFQRKYFHDPENEGGNILEAWLNSKFDLFRSEQIGGPRHPETHGVSPYEATLRLEPLMSLESGSELGFMGALGVTYHLFPDKNGEESTASDWIQRIGLRGGVGWMQNEGENGDFVAGGAVQIRSLTVWGVYRPEEDEFFVAVGSGDFRWLQEATTWFQ